MKGIDYNKALSRDRSNFNETIRRTEDAAAKRIAAANERAEAVKESQREAFVNDKLELEGNYEKNYEKMNDKVRASLNTNNADHNETVDRLRENFSSEVQTKKKDFEQRLNDISNSYRKSFQSEKDTHADLQSHAKKKYGRNISETRSESHKQLKDYREAMSGTGADLKDQYTRERQQLVRSQEDHLTDVYKKSAKRTAELKDHLRLDMDKSKLAQKASYENQKKYQDDRMTNLEKVYNSRTQNIGKEYSDKNDHLVETQQEATKLHNKEAQHNLSEVRRDFNKQLRQLDLEKKRNNNGAQDFAKVLGQQNGQKDASGFEVRYNNLKEQLTEAQKTYLEKTKTDQEASKIALKSEATESTARLDRSLNQANADRIIEVAKEHEKTQVHMANKDHQVQIDRQNFEQQLALEKSNGSERLMKLKENFSKSLRDLEERHSVSIKDVSKVSNKDKAEFVKNLEKNRRDELYQINREFSNIMDSTVQEYELRLSNLQREAESMKLTLDQKVQNISDQTSKQLDTQRTLFEERRIADQRNNQLLIDQKENIHKTEVHQMSTGFQKKIDKMTIDNDTKLKLLTNDYENKLKELRASTSKELSMAMTNSQVELERVKGSYEAEKRTTLEAYESQIASIKQGHRDQMEQLKDYKRLS